jgi:carboxymethylenebutenolidase
MSTKSSEIQLDVNGKAVNAYLAKPENDGAGILLLHAWWGLKPFFKQLCDKLANEGYLVLAPDLRDGQIANTIDEAKALMEQQGEGQFIHDIVMTAKDHLLSMPGRKGKKIAVMGFSMGAAWSVVVSKEAPEQIAASVLFYGAYPIDFANVKAKFIGHFAEVDEWEPMEGVNEMKAEMEKAGVDLSLHIYPNVAHWFMEDDRPEYDSAAASLAWQRTLDFLKENLK